MRRLMINAVFLAVGVVGCMGCEGTTGHAVSGSAELSTDALDGRMEPGAFVAGDGRQETDYAASPALQSPTSGGDGGIAVGRPGELRVTKRYVIYWAEHGVDEAIVLDRIRWSKGVTRLTPADEAEMRESGVSEAVIAAMREKAGGSRA